MLFQGRQNSPKRSPAGHGRGEGQTHYGHRPPLMAKTLLRITTQRQAKEGLLPNGKGKQSNSGRLGGSHLPRGDASTGVGDTRTPALLPLSAAALGWRLRRQTS